MSSFDPATFPQSDGTSVLRYRDGLYAVDLLGAAIVEFDFFNWLAARESTTEAEICEHFGFAARPVDVMITLFAANGYVERRGEQLLATQTAREFLVEGSPWFMKPYYDSLSDRPVLKDFITVLKTGKPANWGSSESEKEDWHDAMERDDFAEMFTAAMDCRGLLLGQALAKKLDLSGRTRVLDIGGGSGIYACVLAELNPGLKATVLEKVPVDGIARRAIEKRGCSASVDVAIADMFVDPLPDADVHLWSNVLHDWDVPEVEQLLARSAEELPPGGLIVIHEALINREKTGPLAEAEYSALLMNVTQGKCYSVSEYEKILMGLGFEQPTHQDTIADRGVMTAVKRG
ncbi:MAG: putative O-methyltransferase YrrM [Verrucomicrobiales bacterium]|jgi:predicted O-methyltransferase YrrM